MEASPLPIDRSIIAEILAQTDLVALIGSHIALTKRGNHFIGLCPFHSERSPSFHVRQDRGYFKCFGCGVGGDAIRFVERMENMPFPEAARTLAKRHGIVMEEEDEYASSMRLLRDDINAANMIAATFFHRILLEHPDGAQAREYCKKRGLDAAAIERFRLGFSPDRWDALRSVLREAGVRDDTAMQAGLLKEGQHGPYDFYRGRLMIPTMSTTGEIVAFGGRALGDEQPKYINTTTTPVYSKGRFLYGLNFARRAAGIAGSIIVVEGYLDCIALQRAGFENAVASLGTAFTEEQGALLRRYTANVYIAFDADKAGVEATAKSLELLHKREINSKVVIMPEGEDPDSVVRAGGKAAFEALLKTSRSSTEYLIDRSIEGARDGFRSLSDLAREAENIVRIQPREEWDRWRVYVANKLGLSIEDVRSAFTMKFVDSRPELLERAANRHESGLVRKPSRDREILTILVEEPTLISEYKVLITPERFRDPIYRALYERLLVEPNLRHGVDILAAVAGDDAATDALLSLARNERTNTQRYADTAARCEQLDRIVATFLREDDESLRRQLNAEIDEYLGRGETVPPELLEEHREVEKRLLGVMRNNYRNN